MGESQSAGWSAEAESRAAGPIEGEAKRLRVVEIAQRYDLDRPYNGARRTGQVLEEIERSEQRIGFLYSGFTADVDWIDSGRAGVPIGYTDFGARCASNIRLHTVISQRCLISDGLYRGPRTEPPQRQSAHAIQ